VSTFPDFTEDVHDALDELEDQTVSAAVLEALDRETHPELDALVDLEGDRTAAITAAIDTVRPALDELALQIARRLTRHGRTLLAELSADRSADPGPDQLDLGYEVAEFARLEAIRQNPTLALVAGFPEAAERDEALARARASLALDEDQLAVEQAWSWQPTLAALRQLLRPTAGHWLRTYLERRHARAKTAVSDAERDPGDLLGTMLRAAFLPAVLPAPSPSHRSAHPALARFRLAIFDGAGDVVRGASLAADRPDLTGHGQAIAAAYADADAALATFAELAARTSAPDERAAPPIDAGDPPLRKITWWRVVVFLLLLAGSIYMYLLR